MFLIQLFRIWRKWIQEEKQHFLLQKKFPTLYLERNVQIKKPKNLVVGNDVIIQRNTVLHCGGMEWCGGIGGIEIGDNSCISPMCVFYGAGARLIIGKNFDCGPGVKIFSSRSRYEMGPNDVFDDQQHLFEDVIIKDNVICYANAVISPGVHVGKGAVIAAGSVVLNDVEAFTVVGGVPAKVLMYRKRDKKNGD